MVRSSRYVSSLSNNEALGGLSIFGNRTKVLAETAANQIGESAQSAQKAIGETSTGEYVFRPKFHDVFFVYSVCRWLSSFVNPSSQILHFCDHRTRYYLSYLQEYGDVSEVASIKSRVRSSSATIPINTVRDTPYRNTACRPHNAASTPRVIPATSRGASAVSPPRDIRPNNSREANVAMPCPRRDIRHSSQGPAFLRGDSCHGLVICHPIRRASVQTPSNREV